MNYPFPTVITQKDGESLVNVHYGVWPFDGAYWKNGSTVMNLFSNLDQQGVSVKQFKILKNQDASIEETFQKRTLQITGNTEYIETVQPADITIDADGNYLVTIRAKKAGAVKITASWPDQNRTKEVYFTLSITDEFSIDTIIMNKNVLTRSQKILSYGFTLTEMLCTVLLVSLVSTMLVTGVLMGSKQYNRSIRISEAQQLNLTIETILANELKYSNRIEEENGQVKKIYSTTYVLSNDLTAISILKNDKDEAVSDGKYGQLSFTDGTSYNRVLPKGSYAKELGVKITSLTYDQNQKCFHVAMDIGTDKIGSLISENFVVRALNPVTINGGNA